MIEREKLISMVQALQNGEENAAAEIYETFQSDVYYFILKTVHNDRELAEDLTQDTFIEILQNIHKLEEPAAFISWSKQIAYHKCTDFFKKRKDLLVDENEDGYSVFDTMEEENEDFIPDAALEKEDLKNTIIQMINDLPGEQRSAIILRYFNEISVKEIAQIQGVSEGTIKSRLNYGRKAIKNAVEDYEKKNDVKLHCAGVIPLLLWLFREYRLSKDLSLSDTAHDEFIFAEESSSAAAAAFHTSSAGGSAVAAAADVGVKAAGTALGYKLLVGVAVAAVAIGSIGIAMGATIGNRSEKPEYTEPQTSFVTEQTTEATAESTMAYTEATEDLTEATTEVTTEPEQTEPAETEAPTTLPTETVPRETEKATKPASDSKKPTTKPEKTEKETSKPTEPATTPPTERPTEPPTEPPTQAPTVAPTEAPTVAPTEAPTKDPTEPPTEAPTAAPTEPPTEAPTQPPTEAPTEPPTAAPTEPEVEDELLEEEDSENCDHSWRVIEQNYDGDVLVSEFLECKKCGESESTYYVTD